MPIILCFLWGAFGGLIPVVAALLINEGHPFTTYWAVDASAPVIKSMLFHIFQIVVFFVLGGIWAYLNTATDALKAFQLGVAAPAVIVGMVAVTDAKKAKEADPQLRSDTNLSISYAHAAIFPLEFPGLLITSQFGGEGLFEILPIEELPKLFGGVERRLASDKLISLYPANKTAVVEAVIKAIQSDSPTSYRVNIYVARTLRLIPGKWEGTDAQREAIRALIAQRSYNRDPTFRENVDGALQNWKPIASN